MSLLDLEPGLRSRCILAMKSDNPLFSFLRTLKRDLPVHIYFSGEKTVLIIYVNSENLESNVSSYLEESGSVLSGENYVVNLTLDSGDKMSIIKEILQQSLVVVNSIYIREGWLLFDFRFHSSKYQDISSSITKYLSEGTDVKLIYLGPSPGLVSLLDKLNRDIPLSVLIFETRMPDGQEDILPTQPDEILLLESTVFPGSNGGQKFVAYRTKDGIVSAVSEVELDTPALIRLRDEANKAHIVRYNVFLKVEEKHVVTMAFLPASLLHDYLHLLVSTPANMLGGRINLVAAGPFSFEIIDTFN